MILNKKKLLWRICSFLLVFATILPYFITVTPALGDALKSAGNGLASLLSNDNDSGIDIYTVNGQYLTIKGQGLYDTPNSLNNSFGDTKYILKAQEALTQTTELRIDKNVTATVTLSEINSLAYLKVVLYENAKLDLIIEGECGVSEIVLESNSEISITGDTLSVGSINFVSGAENTSVSFASVSNIYLTNNIKAHKIDLSGVKLVGSESSCIISDGNMTIDNAVIYASDNGSVDTVSVKKDLTVKGNSTSISTKNIGVSAGGKGQISLMGIGSIRTERIGALDGDGNEIAFAMPDKLEMNIEGNPVQIWDYTIKYMDYVESGYEAVTVDSGDVSVAYRVKITDGASMIEGYHSANGFDKDKTAPVMPSLTRKNYDFRVWSYSPMADDADSANDKTNQEWLVYDGKEWDSENCIIKDSGLSVGYTEANISSDSGHVTVYAIYVPKSVVINLHTNINTDKVFVQIPAYVGAKGISLQEYLEDPALSVNGQNPQNFADAPTDGKIVNISSFTVTEYDADGQIDLYVGWSSGHIRVDYNIPEYYEGYIYQYLDKNGNWVDIPAASLSELNDQLKKLAGALDIYFGSTYGDMLQVRCLKPDGLDGIEYNFVGWYIQSQVGDKIMLDKDTVVSSETTTSNALETGSQIVFALFENTRYSLTVPSSLGKWQFFDENGNQIVFTNNGNGTMSAYVNSDTTVVMKRADETTVVAYWRLTNGTNGSFIWPSERDKSLGGSYWLYYEFTMPKANVTAVYNEQVRWDTAMGDYTFGTFEINGRSSYGFKITDRTTGDIIHQFRWIMSSNKTTVYFTSSKETDHQIKLDAATMLYLDGVKLTERGDILNKLSSFYSSGIYNSSIKTYPFAANQNIIIDNNPESSQAYNASTSYTVTMYLISDSKIFAIGQKSWINNITNNWSQTYRSTLTIEGNNKKLEFYSLLLHTSSSSIKNCNVEVLTTGNDSLDKKIHWFHFDSGDGTISNSKINANGRSMYMRHGGNMSGTGNGVTFTITSNSVLQNVADVNIPFLNLSSSTLEAERILSVGYGFKFYKSTVVADIIGYGGAIHVNYSNSISTFDNCNITVNNWMSLSRPRIYNGTVLNVKNGLHVFESIQIYGKNTKVHVGSFEKFKTTLGNTAQDGKHYDSTDLNHYFYVDIYGGANVTVDGNVNLGVNHSSMPTIDIYGAGTRVEIKGNADIINTVTITSSAYLKVDGNLTLHQDILVDGATLDVGENLYHSVNTSKGDSEYKTVTSSSGLVESVFWTFEFSDTATVTVGKDVGDSSESDKTNVVYNEDNDGITIGGKVIRDIQIIYTIPDGFAGDPRNPVSVKLENNIYVGSEILFYTPIKTGDMPLEFEEDCWYSGNTLYSSIKNGAEFDNNTTIVRLEARVKYYVININSDAGAIFDVKYKEQESDIWETSNVDSRVKIPINATVQLTLRAEYASLVFGESYINEVYTPVPMEKSINGDECIVTFKMSEVQIMLCASKQITLYLDEGHIHIKEQGGEIGFARYTGTGFIPYGGNIVVTQKNTAISCPNTLCVERNVNADTSKLTLRNITVNNLDDSVYDTVYFTPGVTAALHISGTNKIRNIRIPKGADATIIGDDDAVIHLINTPYFSGSYSATDTSRYYSQIGDYSCGKITMIGGKYTSFGSFNHQGSAVSVGGTSSQTGGHLTMERVEFYSNGYLNPIWFSVPSSNIYVKDSKFDIKSHSTAPFRCQNMTVEGTSNIVFSYSTGGDYTVSTFMSVSKTLTLKDNVVVEDTYYGSVNNIYMAVIPNQTMVLSGNAQYTTHGNLLVNSLTVKDKAKLAAVGGTDGMARFIVARNINISGGEVTCGSLIASGFFDSQGAGADLVNAYYNAQSRIVSAGTLTVSGGVINAVGGKVFIVTENNTEGVLTTVKGIVGGSRNAVVKINGGTVNASVIGESDYAFALFRRGVYAINDGYASGVELYVMGGTQSFDLLGGDNASVKISDSASVKMNAGSSIVGKIITVTDNANVITNTDTLIGGNGSNITIEKNSKIYGVGGSDTLADIVASEGYLLVTDNASVHVALVNIEDGEVVISTTNRDITHNFTYGHPAVTGDEKVGLFVDHGFDPTEGSTEPMGSVKGDLAAKTITVKPLAYVSAYRIGSNAGMTKNGNVLFESYSYVYTYAYGAFGSGTIEVTREGQSSVNGKLQIPIHYDLNLGVDSNEKIEDIMPSTGVIYNYTPTNPSDGEPTVQLPLPVPERKGYIFLGWYLGDIRMEYVSSDREFVLDLVARWTPVEIPINLKGNNTINLDEWLDIEFGASSFVPKSYMIGGQYSSSYIIVKADGAKAWASIFGVEKMIPSDTSFIITSALYDAYLKQNGVDYSDGLTEAEKLIIRKIEASSKETRVDGIEYITLYANWNTAVQNIIFDSKDKEVNEFKYGDEIVGITQVGTGAQNISAYVGIPYANGLYLNGTNTSGIPVPIRKGYKFIKWVSVGTDPVVELTVENSSALLINEYISKFEAEYKAKKFRVYLVPNNGIIDGQTLYDGADKITVNGVDIYYYDNIEFDQMFGQTLPATELFGYVYEGWELKLKDGTSVKFNGNTVIKWDSRDVSIPSGYEDLMTQELPDGIDDYLILTPVTRVAKIEYEMHGGQWTELVSAADKDNYTHLLGGEILPTVKYTVTDGVYTISNKNEAFVNSVERHGYRFLGWATQEEYNLWKASGESVEVYFGDSSDKLITSSTVNFADVSYHAIWKACTYKLDLKSRGGYVWANDYFVNGATAKVTYNVDAATHPTQITVGMPSNLPTPELEDANITYEIANDSGSHSARKLLGWMFDGEANPVTDYYHSDGSADSNYARLIAVSMNNGEIFEGDQVFVLPKTQKDPGDGGTITLYAVYRERSLIFVLCTPDGDRKVQLIADYDVRRSGYTDISSIETPSFEGYNLSGWFVNTEVPAAANDYSWYGLESENHPAYNRYFSHVDGFYVKHKDDNGNILLNGTYTMDYYTKHTVSSNNYDIYVYSYYAPQLQVELGLYAQVGKSQFTQINTYVVPNTMNVPRPTDGSMPILYSVSIAPNSGENVTLVDKSVIDNWYSNYYGEEIWEDNGVEYNANSTFAIEMIVKTDTSTYQAIPITNCQNVGNNAYITAGSEIEFIVYSTNRLVTTKSLGEITVDITFPTLALAELEFNAELTRAAAKFELNFDANTPTQETFSDINWSNGTVLSRDETIRWKDFLCGDSQSDLPKLMLTGYIFKGWKDQEGNLLGEDGTLVYVPPVNSSPESYVAQTLTAVWEIIEYDLTLDAGTVENKMFDFTDKDGQKLTLEPVGNVYRIPYKTSVQLLTKPGCEVNQYPEFITVLDENDYGYEMSPSQTFVMPAFDLDVKFNRVKELITVDQNVLINDGSYQIGDSPAVVWRGDYVICAEGGNVSIQTSNSVKDGGVEVIAHNFTLKDNTLCVSVDNGIESLRINVDNATLEKISAPETDLTLVGIDSNSKLTMIPYSGIAVETKNVVVEDLELNVKLTQKQGTGDVNTSAITAKDKIHLNRATLNAVSYSQAATYVGTVLNAPNISVIQSEITVRPDSDGCPVSSNACFIGEKSESIIIDNSVISSTMMISAPNGCFDVHNESSVTMNGQNANVTAKEIYVDCIDGSDSSTSLSHSVLEALGAIIDGEQTIGIYSDVVDHNGRHLDVRNADIEINANGYSHGGRNVSEKSSYVLVGNSTSAATKKSVTINAPFEQTYLDSNSIGKITADGNVRITLLGNSEIKGIEGFNASVEISGDFDLISNGNIIAYELSVKDSNVNAVGYAVGSMGDKSEKIGTVTLDSCTVIAAVVGALGEYDKTFTALTLKNGATVNGKLVKDLYRLKYEYNGDSSSLPHTLRSTVGTDEIETLAPAIPGILEGIEFWYLKDGNGDLYPLLAGALNDIYSAAGLTPVSSLSPQHIEWADDTDPSDSTKTLTVYAWMKITLDESISSDRYLDKIDSSEKTVSVRADGVWTAQFIVEGTLINGSAYSLSLSRPFPKGTMITLMDMSDSLVRYYYYECNGTESSILLSAFVKMGTGNQIPDLLTGTTGDAVSDTLQISVDFSTSDDMTEVNGISVSLKMLIGDKDLIHGASELVYDLTKVPEASVTAEEGKLSVSCSHTDKNIYLAVQIGLTNGNVIPYDATVTLGDISGERVGRNIWVFDLGNPTKEFMSMYIWTVSGLPTGEYVTKWSLSVDDDGKNVLTDVLARAEFTYKEAEKPELYMKVLFEDTNMVITPEREQTISFAIDSNADTVYKIAQILTPNAQFVDTEYIRITDSEIVIPRGIDKGVYRICFSIDENGVNDDVYFTFIIK